MDLDKIIDDHFSGQTREPLVRGVFEEMKPENVIDFFGVDNLIIKKRAARLLSQKTNDSAYIEKIKEGLNGEENVRTGLLTALSYINCPKEIFNDVSINLDHESKKVRQAAARVIAYQFPEKATLLIPMLGQKGIDKTVCYARNEKTIMPLLNHYGYPDNLNIPSYFGFTLNPRWFANNYNPNLDQVMKETGYVNGKVDESVLELLSEGFMFVSEKMKDIDLSQSLQRIDDLRWELLPYYLNTPKGLAIDLNNDLDIDLFFNAVRKSDIDNLQLGKESNPFDYRTKEHFGTMTCAHAPYEFVKKFFFDKAIEEAEKLEASAEEYILDHARVLLETHQERRVEMDALTKSKWRIKGIFPVEFSFPVVEESDFPNAKYGVIDKKALPKVNRNLSVGAQSVVNLANYLGEDVENQLLDLENQYSQFLLPAGIEIQMSSTNKYKSLCWKQALRYFGIPSPRRPEYRYMVEAAFRPSKSFHAPILGTFLLDRLGVMENNEEMAYHISIQGDIKEIENIAFPQQFCHRRRKIKMTKEERHYAMSRLMSKGFVNHNQDVEPVDNKSKADCRTEVRVFGCYRDDKLLTTFVDDFISTHLLVSANYHNWEEWDEFKDSIMAYTLDLDSRYSTEIFTELLNSNWYQSTGDPRDGKLVGMLPIIKTRDLARDLLVDSIDAVESKFLEIIGKYSRKVHNRVMEEYGIKLPSGMKESEFGLPYFCP